MRVGVGGWYGLVQVRVCGLNTSRWMGWVEEVEAVEECARYSDS